MNEILAVLIIAMYPYYSECNICPDDIIQKLEHFDTNNHSLLNDFYSVLFDEKEFEADIYELFDVIMKRGVKEYYYIPPDQIIEEKNNSPLSKVF
jgi:hypothetical protein